MFFFTKAFWGLFFHDVFLPKIGFRKYAERTRPKRLTKIANGYHDLAVKLGGVMIKVGQFLSARMDVLPEEITAALSGLQDEVPPEDFADIKSLAEAELGAPLEEIFLSFDEKPMAAASLGQVHYARLKEDKNTPEFGNNVVVKIQRPNIEQIIATDLRAFHTAGRWLMKYEAIRKRVDVPSLMAEFSKILYEEIDYLSEGRNAEKFGVNFEKVDGVRVPDVVWHLTTKRVLVLENVFAIKITDYKKIEEKNIDRSLVATRLFDAYMRQIFKDGFFHADPHPGNLFVDPNGSDDGEGWQLTFIDFGMAGHIPPNAREGLRELIIGVVTKDSKRIVQSYKTLNILLPSADTELLEQAEEAAFDRFWGKSLDELKEISFEEMHEFAFEFRELVYTMPFQVPQDLIFLFRTFAILAGICTGLDPEFNFWNVLNPYAKELLAEEVAPGILSEAGAIFQSLIALPRKTENVLDRISRGGLIIKTPATERQLKRIERSLGRILYVLFFFAFLMGGIQLFLAQQIIFAYVMFGFALIALIIAMLPRRRMF
jgi:predicted unusual protein kinase regulating ubiquinone biosynthesis (AarF/ABC1/UbiB family)